MTWRLRGSLTGRIGLALALTAILTATLTATALRWTRSPVIALAIALTAGLPALLWLVARTTRPWRQTLKAISSGIESLGERDFGVTIATPAPQQLRMLVEAYNALATRLRRERFDVYQRELLLDTVLQSTPVALVLSNDAGRVVFGNVAARELLRNGRRLEGLQFQALLSEQPAELRAAIETGADTLFTLGTPPDSEVYRVSRREFLLNTRTHELWLLERLTRELATQEISVWKKVIRVIAHELNNSVAPISSLVHSGRVLARDADPKTLRPQLERIFATIGERTDHLAVFIDGYARFTKLPRPQFGPLLWEPLLRPLSASLGFHIEEPLPQGETRADAGQLEQVIINLIKNAQESGSPPDQITVRVQAQAHGCVLEVADRGTGLAEHTLRDALLPFFSTKPSGSGLGLTLCREIIEAHGGRLTLANRPGGGALVTVHLP